MKKTCPGGTRKCNSQLSAVDNGKHMMSIIIIIIQNPKLKMQTKKH